MKISRITLAIDDMAATAAQVRQLGGRMHEERVENGPVTSWGLDDPDGNSLVLIEEGGG